MYVVRCVRAEVAGNALPQALVAAHFDGLVRLTGLFAPDGVGHVIQDAVNAHAFQQLLHRCPLLWDRGQPAYPRREPRLGLGGKGGVWHPRVHHGIKLPEGELCRPLALLLVQVAKFALLQYALDTLANKICHRVHVSAAVRC